MLSLGVMVERIKALEQTIQDQQESIEKMQGLLKLLLDNVSKNGVKIECFLLDYANALGSIESQNPNDYIRRVDECCSQSLSEDDPSKLN